MSNAQNPYSKASDAYGMAAAETDQRMMEGRILLKAATMLELLAQRLEGTERVPLEDIGDILDYNQKLWQLFVDEAQNKEHPLPADIKKNILTLGVYVFKRTLEVLIDTKPEKLKVLIDINRNIAAGLMKMQAQSLAAGSTNPLATNPEAAGRPVEMSSDSFA